MIFIRRWQELKLQQQADMEVNAKLAEDAEKMNALKLQVY